MKKTQTDYYAKTTRSMLACVKEVGAMPFILFEYYLTWETASDGIRPPLQTVADDLGLEKNAVCNLRSRLVKAGWIRYENEQVFIIKSFTKNESKTANRSQKMNDDSQKMNEPFTKNEQPFTKNESPYKEENKQRINIKKEQREEESASEEDMNNFGADTADELFGEPTQPILDEQDQFCQTVLDGLRERLKVFNEHDFAYQTERLWQAEIFTAEMCVETYDLLDRIRALKKGGWRIKADYWAESVPRLESLKLEIEQLENGANNGISTYQTTNGKQGKPAVESRPAKTTEQLASEWGATVI